MYKSHLKVLAYWLQSIRHLSPDFSTWLSLLQSPGSTQPRVGGILPRLVLWGLSFWFLPREAVLGEGLVTGRQVGPALAALNQGDFACGLASP